MYNTLEWQGCSEAPQAREVLWSVARSENPKM